MKKVLVCVVWLLGWLLVGMPSLLAFTGCEGDLIGSTVVTEFPFDEGEGPKAYNWGVMGEDWDGQLVGGAYHSPDVPQAGYWSLALPGSSLISTVLVENVSEILTNLAIETPNGVVIVTNVAWVT